ncbi:unnamed protein product [Leptidea sinapis]|uniref:Rubredoxin-like domain-containing protein n=1 Tax=Leptidea sinapis TaxID=189913 RepID=A0A5E4PX42_9NEOP|nr:unnamed protein product [Leptidea sinapis]
MANNCNACNSKIMSLEYFECASCGKLYDVDCLKDTWICPGCVCTRPKTDNSTTPIQSNLNSTYTNEQGNINLIRGSRGSKAEEKSELASVLTEIRLLRQELQALKQQNSEIFQDLKTVKCELHSLTIKLEHYDRKFLTQQTEITNLKGSLQRIESTINNYEQSLLKKEIEIVVSLSENDVDYVERAGPKASQMSKSRSSPVTRPIVIRLVRRSKRDEILQAAKLRRNLTSEGITAEQPSNILYINERLTKFNRQLFREARQQAKEHNFNFCWVRNGTIYVRKAEKLRYVTIKSGEDLQNCFKNKETQQNISNIQENTS